MRWPHVTEADLVADGLEPMPDVRLLRQLIIAELSWYPTAPRPLVLVTSNAYEDGGRRRPTPHAVRRVLQEMLARGELRLTRDGFLLGRVRKPRAQAAGALLGVEAP